MYYFTKSITKILHQLKCESAISAVKNIFISEIIDKVIIFYHNFTHVYTISTPPSAPKVYSQASEATSRGPPIHE